MSLKSFLAKLWTGIKSLFAKLPADVKTAIHIGVVITENIKNFVDSPIADVITTIIPGDIDDKLKDLLRTELPKIIINLKLAEIPWKDGVSGDAVVYAGIQKLKSIESETLPAFLHSISILVAKVLADGKLTWSDGAYVSEWYYQTEYKPAA
jgi:hypothetical protein